MFARKYGRWPWKSDYTDVLEVAAAHGHLEVIKWLQCGRGIGNVDDTVFDRAASKGHLALAQWLYKTFALMGRHDTLSNAAENGHMEVVKWLYENLSRGRSIGDGKYMEPTLSEKTASATISAARGGHLELLQWLHQQVNCGDVCTTSIMGAAIKSGHLDVVKWLFANCNAGCSKYAARDAALRGDLPMLQWLYQHFDEMCHLNVMDHAAMGGHLDVLKWLHKHREEGCTSDAMDSAAANGYLDIVQWLHENRNEGCTAYAMKTAADEGHLHVVKWLHENRYEGCGDFSHMYYPVINGHLEVVKWLVKHKPEMYRKEFMELAAWESHLDMVCYLDENTRQDRSRIGLGAAAREGLVPLVFLLMRLNRGIRVGNYIVKTPPKLLCQLVDESATSASPLWNERLKLLELFHSNKFLTCVSTMLDRALYHGDLVTLRQFFKSRDELDQCFYVSEATNNIVLMRWMFENATSLSVFPYVCSVYAWNFEAAWWVSERERVRLVCNALYYEFHEMLLWVLENTVFEEESSKHAIRCSLADHEANAKWLFKNLANENARSWCFPNEKKS